MYVVKMSKDKSRRLYGLYERISILQEYAHMEGEIKKLRYDKKFLCVASKICAKHKIPYRTLHQWVARYADDVKMFDDRVVEKDQRIEQMGEVIIRLRKRNAAMRADLEAAVPGGEDYRKLYLAELNRKRELAELVTKLTKRLTEMTKAKAVFRTRAFTFKARLDKLDAQQGGTTACR